MNSRFKFRVWDTDIKEYLVGEFLVGGCGDMIHNVVDYESFLNKGNYIIEQCTGLTDKNGNLIYEGDYIKDKWGNTTYLIKWVDAKFMCIDTEETMPDTSPRQDWLDKCGFEIIGNIHEQVEQKE